MNFYMSGTIPKGEDLKQNRNWREDYAACLRQYFTHVEMHDPTYCLSEVICPESNEKFWFGHDCHLIKSSDIIIVKADEKLGVGTAQEILIAKYFAKPVVAVLPKNAPHRIQNLDLKTGFVADWIHPFLAATADLIVEKLEDAVDWIKEYEADPSCKAVKDISVIDQNIDYYLTYKPE